MHACRRRQPLRKAGSTSGAHKKEDVVPHGTCGRSTATVLVAGTRGATVHDDRRGPRCQRKEDRRRSAEGEAGGREQKEQQVEQEVQQAAEPTEEPSRQKYSRDDEAHVPWLISNLDRPPMQGEARAQGDGFYPWSEFRIFHQAHGAAAGTASAITPSLGLKFPSCLQLSSNFYKPKFEEKPPDERELKGRYILQGFRQVDKDGRNVLKTWKQDNPELLSLPLQLTLCVVQGLSQHLNFHPRARHMRPEQLQLVLTLRTGLTFCMEFFRHFSQPLPEDRRRPRFRHCL